MSLLYLLLCSSYHCIRSRLLLHFCCCCFRKEKAHDEVDSQQSMIGGVTEEEELERRKRLWEKICELKVVADWVKKVAESKNGSQEHMFWLEQKDILNDKIQELETKIMTASLQPPAGSDAFAVLTDDALLTNIFEFVGVFEYRFVASLNKRFRKLYSEFQKRRIHQAPDDDSALLRPYYNYFSTSLTSTASVAESTERGSLLMADMKARKCNYVIKLRRREGDGTSLGCFYDVVGREHISDFHTFLRDKVALRYGNTKLLDVLRIFGCQCNDTSSCYAAAQNGHLEILQWARANGCPWNKSTCVIAVERGHLDVLQWARANGCPWDESTSHAAACDGHLEMLQWARANGCPWDEGTCAEAARNGHVEVLQWARANGCPWNHEWTWRAAVRNGHLEVLQWAHANGCTRYEWTCLLAARLGNLEVLQWARQNGYPWDEWTCAEAARFGYLTILQWLHANGCPWDEQTCANAYVEGEMEVYEWARANGCPE